MVDEFDDVGLPPPQPKKRGGKRSRPIEQAHLPPVEPPIASLIGPNGELDMEIFYTLFLAHVPLEAIQKVLPQLDINDLRDILKRVSDRSVAETEALLERLTLLNIARIEGLMPTWYLAAQGADEKAAKVVISLIQTQEALLKAAREELAIRRASGQGSTSMTRIERYITEIEQTISLGSAEHKLAQQLLAQNTDVVDAIPELYEQTSTLLPASSDDLMELLNAVEETPSVPEVGSDPP